MKNYILGFIVGIILCIGYILFVGLGFNYFKTLGPCPDISKEESIEMIMKFAKKPGVFSPDGKTDYDDIELVEEPGFGQVVYTKKEGKRVTRHFPSVQCGYLEWASDPDFKPEQ